MTAKKIIGVLPANAANARQFVCPAETDRTEDVTLLFKDDLAAQKLEVVQLSLEGLPGTFHDKPVTWFANFGIRQSGSDKYVDVSYTVLVKPRDGKKLIVFDGKEAKLATTAMSKLAGYTDKLEVSLNIGDPGLGWGE